MVRDIVPNAVRLALLLAALAGCHAPPPGLTPLEQPSNVQAAPPRISGAIALDQTKLRAFQSVGAPVSPHIAPQPPPEALQGGDVTLNFVDTDIREIVRTVLGATLKLNYTIDPNVHGTGSLQTGKPLPRSALLPVLETLLNQNGATMVERTGIYDVVPMASGAVSRAVRGAGSVGAGTEVIPLRFASGPDLVKVLSPYVAEGGKLVADPAHNAVIISGDAPVRETLTALVHAFDIDLLSGQSYALFPAGNGDPAKLATELEKVLQAESGGPLAGVVRVLPMTRANAVLVVSTQPRYLDAARRFFRLVDKVEDATARQWHVYYVQNGRSADLENLLQRAFTPGHVQPTTPAPGSTAPGQRTTTLGGMGQSGGSGTLGTGTASTGLGAGPAGTSSGTGVGGTSTGGLGSRLGSTQATTPGGLPATEPLSTPTGGAGAEQENRMRILADLRNNALLIFATPSEYSVVEGMLRKIDIVPLQVLIEATVAEVTLNDALQYGTQFYFKNSPLTQTLGTSVPNFPNLLTGTQPLGFAGFVLASSPHFALAALADVSQVKVLSAPEVMVLDNEPAKLVVGQNVPVLTGTATSTLTTGAPVVNSVDYQETGVILQVTPRVNSGGLVTLDIGQEVSDVGAPAANTVQGSPTFDDRVIQTRVAVQDGQTVGLAGLIQDSSTKENSGLPWLKDIPILGTLASSQNNSRNRKELLVLITPHVVRDQTDARALTEDLRSELVNAGLVPQQLDRERPVGRPNPNGL